jgi:hypothetical protein
MFNFFPEPNLKEILFFVAAAITIMFGSIPQQDVFQRVMSANSLNAATKGPIIGGICYILFAFVPMFLVVSALIIMPEKAAQLIEEDPQKVLPTLVMDHMPFIMQVLFFGALLSAIKSCASATLLAPSVTFTENIWRQFRPHQSDYGLDFQWLGLGLRYFHAGKFHLRDGFWCLSGHSGWRFHSLAFRPVLAKSHHPRCYFCHCFGSPDLAAFALDPCWRRISSPIGGCFGQFGRHVDRFFGPPSHRQQAWFPPRSAR